MHENESVRSIKALGVYKWSKKEKKYYMIRYDMVWHKERISVKLYWTSSNSICYDHTSRRALKIGEGKIKGTSSKLWKFWQSNALKWRLLP